LFWGFIIFLSYFYYFFPKVFWIFEKWTKKMSKIEKGRKTFPKMQHL